MRFIAAFASICLISALPLYAQGNGGPAELPPPGFEGREYTDSQGCVFLRSTFGGTVTWVPRFGPNRQPVCNGTPAAEPEVAQSAPIAPERPVPAGSQAAPSIATAKEPAPRPRATTRAQAPKRRAPAMPRADASGRHPNCPASAPYGQLVDTTLGRPLVRCVTSPSLFIDPKLDHGATVAPRATPTRGRVVQAGSFAVPANATRLQSRFRAAGLPARIHVSRGLHVVTVGPLGNQAQVQHALAAARRMGVHDAFVR